MASPFDITNYPFPMYAIREAVGGMNQQTGEYVLGSSAEEVVVGSLETLPMDMDERPFSYEGPIVNQGEARLHTEMKLKKGDRLKVSLDAEGTEFLYYRVVSLRSNYAMMNTLMGIPQRREYELKKEDESAS